jgi:hypothetical protein
MNFEIGGFYVLKQSSPPYEKPSKQSCRDSFIISALDTEVSVRN